MTVWHLKDLNIDSSLNLDEKPEYRAIAQSQPVTGNR